MLCLKAFLISTFIPITFSNHWLHFSPCFVSVFKSHVFTVPCSAACTNRFSCTLLISLSVFLLTRNHHPPLIPIPPLSGRCYVCVRVVATKSSRPIKQSRSPGPATRLINKTMPFIIPDHGQSWFKNGEKMGKWHQLIV